MNDDKKASQNAIFSFKRPTNGDNTSQPCGMRSACESVSPEMKESALANKTSEYNNRAFDTQRIKNPSQAFDIPSILINNLVDENGEIRENVHIPEELLQYYQSQYSKTTNHRDKLKNISSTMTSFQSQKSLQKGNQNPRNVSNALKNHVKILNEELEGLSPPQQLEMKGKCQEKDTLEISQIKQRGLTEALLKEILQTSSLHSIKNINLEASSCPYTFNKFDQPLVNLPNLLSFSIVGHHIQKIENLSFLTQLKNLDLSSNHITVIERLESLKNLESLNLSHNRIQNLPFQVFSRLQHLEILDVSYNQIQNLSEVKSLIQNKQLQELSFVGNPSAKQESYKDFVVCENLIWITILDGQNVCHYREANQNIRRKQNAQVRPKSDTKTQNSQRKLLSLNFNLEKKVFNQTKKIQKKDQEFINAMEYVTCLEEELLNIKINSLYNQSAVCSPRQYQNSMYNSELEPHLYSITERVLCGSTLSPKPLSDRKLLFKFPENQPSKSSMAVINNLLPESKAKSKSSLVKDDYLSQVYQDKENQRDSMMNVQKNLQEAFDDTKKLEKSQSAQLLQRQLLSPAQGNKSPSYIGQKGTSISKLINKDKVSIEQIQEQISKVSSEQHSNNLMLEQIRGKIHYKSEVSKQYDYQIKEKMVKAMEICQKVNLQCDEFKKMTSNQNLIESSLGQVIDERLLFIRKFLTWRIDVLKKKSKLQVVSSQLQFLNLELSFQKQSTQSNIILQNESLSPLVTSLISKDAIAQLSQIVVWLQVKQSKLQQKLSDLENKIKLQSQLSNQQLLDQSVYDYYSNLQEASQSQKQQLKQSEYELQKSLKKFKKIENLISQKIQQLENIVKHDQIQLIKEYRVLLVATQDKKETLNQLKERIVSLKEEESISKINQLQRNLKVSEIERKKLTQRLILRRNDSVMTQQEKEEYEGLKKDIERLEKYHQEFINEATSKDKQKGQKSQNKLNTKVKKQAIPLSPGRSKGLIIEQMIQEMKNLIKIIEGLNQREKQNAFEMRRQSQNFNDLEAYLQSTTMISPSPKVEPIGFGPQDPTQHHHLSRNQHQTFNQSNLSGQVLRTFDNNNPLLNTTNTLQLGNKSQLLSQTCVFSQQDYEYLKSSNQVLKQQLVESENERDQLLIESINKKESYESVLRNIREQITEKEQKYSLFFKEMQTSIIELQKRNNEMIIVNSDLIKKICSDTPRGTIDNSKEAQVKKIQINHTDELTAEVVKRLQWLLNVQSGIIEDLVKQKAILESKQQSQNVKSQHEIERISTSGTFDNRGKKNSVSTFDNRSQFSENQSEKHFQSQDLRQLSSQLGLDAQRPSRESKFMTGSFNKNQNQALITDLTQNTENNMIQHLFEIFQQNYIHSQQAQYLQTETGVDTLQTQGTFSKEPNHQHSASIQHYKRQKSVASQLNKTSESHTNQHKQKSHNQSIGSLKLPKSQNRKSLTKPQSTNQTKDSINNQNIMLKNAKQNEEVKIIESQKHQVSSPKILENNNIGCQGSLAQNYQANLDLGSQSSYQNMNFIASFQNQNSMFQLNSSTESAKQKFNDLMNQSSIQLINNTNLLINNDFDQVDNNLPPELFDGRMLHSNSDSSPLDMPTLNFNIGQNDTNLQLQSLLNMTNRDQTSRNEFTHSSTDGDSSKNHLSNQNYVWTAGLKAPQQPMSIIQVPHLMHQNTSQDKLCQILSGSLDQYETNALSRDSQGIGLQNRSQAQKNSQQSQQSLIQTFGKKSLRLPPSGIQSQSSLNSFRSMNQQSSLNVQHSQRERDIADQTKLDKTYSQVKRIESNRGSITSVLQEGSKDKQHPHFKRASQDLGNGTQRQPMNRQSSGIIRSNR